MKRIFASIMSFCVLLSLCSCTEPSKQGEISSESTASEKQETTHSESEQLPPVSEESILSRSKISKTLDSGVVIDADVTTINRESLAKYTGALRVFSVDEVAETLGLSPEAAVSSQTSYSLEGYIPGDSVYLKFEDNSELVHNMARFYYASDTFLTVRDLLVTDGSENNADLFLTGENLNFATIEQAEVEIQKILNKLGIPVVNDPLRYSLDFENLSDENERQYALAVEEAKGFNQQMFSPKKFTITEDDACYMFYYPIAVDGMPVSNRMNGVYGDGSLMSGTELVVCYSKDGIAGLSLNYQPKVLEKGETKPVLSLEEILRKLE
ncbi:MAG: hypothetical protein RSC76_07835 [Oscillospiraceae bacterium]